MQVSMTYSSSIEMSLVSPKQFCDKLVSCKNHFLEQNLIFYCDLLVVINALFNC